MALDSLATMTDLSARGIEVTDGSRVTAFLNSASEAVRSAAGVPISRTTCTFDIPSVRGQWLQLPGQPVVSVAEVKLDDVEISDWKLVGGRLWRACGWEHCEPVNVTVTQTCGLLEVPDDIIDLVASLVGGAMARAEEGYESQAGKAYESIDDYRVGYTQGGDAITSPMELAQSTRNRLAARFGGGAVVLRAS